MTDLITKEARDKATEKLSLLGSGHTDYPNNPADAELEVIPNLVQSELGQDQDYLVSLDCHEFTCVCPKTGQPDFAELEIQYVPDKLLVESKALKIYLFSYRNHGIFHEFVINKIAKDLFDAMQPKYIRVVGNFSPRGGIAIIPKVELGDKTLGRELLD